MGFYYYGGSSFIFGVIPIIVMVGFIIVIGSVIFRVIGSGIEWNKNNNSTLLTVQAKVVAKRMLVSQYTHNNHSDTHMNSISSSTIYYATFEVESGDRMELKLSAKEYGLIADGDKGKLSFQGTRFKSFERDYKLLNKEKNKSNHK